LEDQGKEVNKNSVERIARVMGEVDQLLKKHDMRVCVKNGMYFDDDENGRVRVRLSIEQTYPWGEKDGNQLGASPTDDVGPNGSV